MRPVAVLLAVWVPVAWLASRLGADPKVLGDATKVVCQPLWFIGVYLMVSALAPPMRDLHLRHRARVLVALAALAIVVDIVRFGGGVGVVGWANMLFVWLFAQQLGFFYADGTLARWTRPGLWALAGCSLAALVLLTTFGPYPHSMVGLPGERVSNMAPPTVCLLALTVLQVAVVMLARDAVSRWLQRARVWTGVVAGNGVIMTIFLWHLSVLLVTVLVLFPIGFPQPAGGSALWWVTRPLWIACAAIPLAAFVALLRAVRTTAPDRLRRHLRARDVAGRHRYCAARARDLWDRERHAARHRARKRSARARRHLAVAGDGARRRGLVVAPRLGARRVTACGARPERQSTIAGYTSVLS